MRATPTAGGSDAAKRLLAGAEQHLEAPSNAGMRLVLRLPSSDKVIVGVRLLVGVTGSSHRPVKVRTNPRRAIAESVMAHLHASMRRATNQADGYCAS